MAAEGMADADAIALTENAMRLGVLAVDLDLAPFARALRFRARFEQARDVEPDVEADRVAHMRISIFAFALSALTKASVSAWRLCWLRYCSICGFASSIGTTLDSCFSATLMMW